MVNKETLLFGSFSENPGNKGAIFFNEAFSKYNLNAIYKPFKILNISDAINAMKTLKISGAGVSMPFKEEVLKYVDFISEEVEHIQAANTLKYSNNSIYAYNTDYISCKFFIEKTNLPLFIVGNGGFSKSAQYAARILNKDFYLITRDNWKELSEIKNSFIINTTPVENIQDQINESNTFIDCIIGTETGNILAEIQAKKQFELYTGINYS